MCGIVGFISKWKSSGFQMTHQKMIYQMLYADALRGQDATGVIGVMKDGDFGIMKEACDGYNFNYSYVDSDLDKMLYTKGTALIGHNRAKTIGENKDENAHPFVVDGTFAMVHNGTLRNHKDMHDTEVDSHALAMMFKEAMDQEDWKTAMEHALGKVNGAFAVVWYDQKRDEICMIRNHERPLGLVKLVGGYLFGSEVPMLTWIAARNNEKVEEAKTLTVNTLYRFDMKKTGGDYSETFLSPVTPTKAPKKKGFDNGVVSTGPLVTTTSKEDAAVDAVIKRLFLSDKGASSRAAISKNAFKRLRARVIGKRINWWVEDYVDVEVSSRGECTRALVMGVSLDGAHDLCEVQHHIRTTLDLKHHGLKESELFGAVQLESRVADMEFDKGTVILRMDETLVKEVSGEILH